MFYLKSVFNLNAYKTGIVFGVIGVSGLFSISCYAEDNWTFNLKNAYIDRNFDNSAIKDFGSWSQSASLFYKSDYYSTPIENLHIGVDGTIGFVAQTYL